MNYKSFLTDTWTKFSQLFNKFVKKTFVGTRAEWDLLSVAEKKQYDLADFTDDTASGVPIISDTVTDGDMNAVTSNAVAQTHKLFGTNTTHTLTRDATAGDVYIWLLGETYLAFVAYTSSRWWNNVLVGTATITTDGDAVTITTAEPKTMLAIIAKGRIL